MTRLARARTALLIASAVWGASCISCTSLAESFTTSAESVIGGSADTTDEAAVALVRADGTLLCSGTVVAPTLVLTAGHCVSGATAAAVKVVFGSDITNPDSTIPVASLFAYPTYDSSVDAIPGGTDLGFVVLATPTSVTPLAIETSVPAGLVAGGSVDAIGYGQSNGGVTTSTGVRDRATLSVATACARLLTAGNASTNVCEGDSGGPVLFGGRIVAVISGATGLGCIGPSDLTRTDAHADWIASVLAAGGEPTSCTTCVTPDPSCTASTETMPAGDTAAPAADDAGPSHADGGPSSTAHGGGGCSTAGGSAPGRASVPLFLAAALLARCARRRRRRR